MFEVYNFFKKKIKIYVEKLFLTINFTLFNDKKKIVSGVTTKKLNKKKKPSFLKVIFVAKCVPFLDVKLLAVLSNLSSV